MLDTRLFYDSNKDFKEYVNRFIANKDLPLEEALNHAIVKEVAKYYKDKQDGKDKNIYI